MQLDGALREVCSVLHNSQANPALRVRLQSLDLNYSALLRVLYEVLQAAHAAHAAQAQGEEEEEGAVSAPEKQDSNSIRSRLASVLENKVPAVPATIAWAPVGVSPRRDA